MAGTKISQLPTATTPLTGAELVPVVQSSSTYQTTAQGVANLAALPLAASGGSNLVGFLQAGTGAVARTVQSKERDTVSVKDFGAVGDGTTDDTAAIQAAIAASGVGGLLIWAKGTYKVTSTLNMTYSGQHWQGAGGNGTIILFAPTANGTCVAWGTSATESVRTGISGVTFYSNDSTYTKVALNVIRCSEGIFRDISVSGSVVVSGTQMWTGATSVGIKTSGHEACRFMDLGIAADVPLQISQGASRASYANLDIDHFNFHNLYLLANANPCVLIDTGVNLTQVSFTGQQAWVLGSSGLQWVDTTSTQSSNGLSIANVRTEQGTSAAAYTFDIQHNYELQNLSLFSCLLDPARRGIKLRKTSNVILLNASYPGTLEAFNVDGTVNRIDVRNCFWQAASTASITGQRIVSAAPLTPNTGPLSPTVLYDLATNTFRNEIHDGVISASSITVAAAGLASLGPTGVTSILMISDSIGVNAIFMLNGGNNSTYEVSDPAGQFSITAGTASSTNIYWSAGNSRYELQNNTAGTLKYVVVYLGSYSVVS